MRILVTGRSGFVGRWLTRELEATGHEVVGAGGPDRLDVTDGTAVAAAIRSLRPDAIAHLAAVSFAPDAAADPGRAIAVNVGGMASLMRALDGLPGGRVLFVAGSSEVYARPEPAALPLTESSPIAPRSVYGVTKLAQEVVAISGSSASRRVVVTRGFNHTGPGQRSAFAIPAFTSRIVAARAAGSDTIAVGNIDVRRDIGDVRDVVRAYRLLIECAMDGGTPDDGLIANVATGSSISMREAIAMIATRVGIDVRPVVDPTLLREGDTPDIRGDATRLERLVGWHPAIPFEQTVADMIADLTG